MTAMPAGSSQGSDWRVTLGVPLGVAILRLLALTWRIEFRHSERWRANHDHQAGSVLALWHGELLPIAFAMRENGILVLVSEHRDGEIISRVLRRLGNDTIRGSTTRGGARALAEMARQLKAGKTVAVTPDGPRGPAHRFAPGALVAAQRAGVPVITMRARVARAWRLRSWDAFVIPKPFARIIIEFGAPALVGGSTPADAAAEASRFEALMATSEYPADG